MVGAVEGVRHVGFFFLAPGAGGCPYHTVSHVWCRRQVVVEVLHATAQRGQNAGKCGYGLATGRATASRVEGSHSAKWPGAEGIRNLDSTFHLLQCLVNLSQGVQELVQLSGGELQHHRRWLAAPGGGRLVHLELQLEHRPAHV
eukprot:EG_transcript_32954